MPTVALEIPETYDSITRPVTTGVVRDLIEYFELPNDTNVRYTGSAQEMAQRGSALADHRSNLHFPFGNRVNVELVETYLEEGVLNTAVKRRDNNFVFLDPQLLVSMKPVYTKTEAVISFRYRTTSRVQALKWRDTLRRKLTQGTQAILHEIVYHYPTPPVLHAILEHIHTKRETVAGYGDSFTEWLKQHYDPRMTVLSNQSGSRGAVVIPEKQIQVQGWLDFASTPDEPEKQEDGDTWTISFDYTIQYDKVTAMVLDYPIVVHNQLLDDKYLDYQEPYNPYEVPRNPSHTGRLAETFSKTNYSFDYAFEGVKIPTFDHWKPRGNSYREVPVFTALAAVELDDPHQIANLLELGDTHFTQSVLNFLYRERYYLTTHLASVFHVTFYRGNLPLSANDYYVDEDLNVRSKKALNPRDVHHFRVAIVTDLGSLSRRAKDALRRDPEVCFQVVDVLDGLQRPWLPISNTVGVHTKAELPTRGDHWESDKPSRPGFTLPGGRWPAIKPKPGNTLLPRPEWGGGEGGNVWHPVDESLKDLVESGAVPDWPLLKDWIENGAIIVIGNGMDEGKETLVLIWVNLIIRITVNYFKKGEVIDKVVIDDTIFEDHWRDPDFDLVVDDESLRDYIDEHLGKHPVIVIINQTVVLKILSPVYHITIVTPDGIYKPTDPSSKPERIVSPTRPNVNGPMVSDDLDILGGKVVTLPSFDRVGSILRPDVNLTGINHGQGMRTVMQAGIITHRSN